MKIQVLLLELVIVDLENAHVGGFDSILKHNSSEQKRGKTS